MICKFLISVTVALEMRIYIYDFSNLALNNCIDTYSNPNGIMAINSNLNNFIIASPSLKLGRIFITNLSHIIRREYKEWYFSI